MEETFIDSLAKMVAINFANYRHNNYMEIFSPKLKIAKWVANKNNRQDIQSFEYLDNLVEERGKTDYEVYELFLESEKIRLKKEEENENKKR